MDWKSGFAILECLWLNCHLVFFQQRLSKNNNNFNITILITDKEFLPVPAKFVPEISRHFKNGRLSTSIAKV
jgi:hypothetical protein